MPAEAQQVWHLAQCNIARALAPLDSDQLAGFTNRIEEINALAERQPGFVWRMVGAGNSALDLAWDDDPLCILNISVWLSVDTLKDFLYRTAHKDLMAQRRDWFKVVEAPHLVMWWIKAGTLPTVSDARDRMALLEAGGPAPEAFTLRHAFPHPTD